MSFADGVTFADRVALADGVALADKEASFELSWLLGCSFLRTFLPLLLERLLNLDELSEVCYAFADYYFGFLGILGVLLFDYWLSTGVEVWALPFLIISFA